MSTPLQPTTATGVRKKKRSGATGACNFCRKMHSSCEGRPRCNSCVSRGIECVFMEKKKPGPPLGFKKRKKPNSMRGSTVASKDLEKRGKKGGQPMVNPIAPLQAALPTANPTIEGQSSITMSPIIATPHIPSPVAAVNSGASPLYVEYFSKEASPISYPAEFSAYLSDLTLNTSPSSPYPTFDPYNSTSTRLMDGFPDTPEFLSISTPSPAANSSQEVTPTMDQNTPGCYFSSTLGSSSPASTPIPYSPSSLENDSYSSSLTLSTSSIPSTLEITFAPTITRRINPDRIFASTPYVRYLEVFQRFFQEDVLGVFPFIEVPSLENLLPLAGMTREGKLSQILLLTVLSIGALNSEEQSQFRYMGDLALKAADDYILEQKDRSKNTLTKKELQQECISFLLLSIVDRASGSFARTPQITCYMINICNEYLKGSRIRSLDHTTSWIVAHFNAKSKFLLSRDDRDRKNQQLILSLPTADPGVKLFSIFNSLLEQLVDSCCMNLGLSASDLGWFQSLVDQGEDLLSFLATVPPYGESAYRTTYEAIFSVIRAVMLYLSGCYNSAIALAKKATYKLLECIDSKPPGFFMMPIALAYIAKIHCFNNDHEMLQVCLTAMRKFEPRFPAIHIFWSGLVIPTSDKDGWFPDAKELIMQMRESTLSMNNNKELVLEIDETEPPQSSNGILGYMDSVFECDWL